jgi:hypothetical protein
MSENATEKRARVSVTSFDPSMLDTFSNPADDEIKALAPAPRGIQAAERTPFMLGLDAKNQELYAAFVAAGSPEKWEGTPAAAIGTLKVPADQAKVIARVIYNSARFVGYSATFGNKDAKTKDGRAVISWKVVPYTPRPRKNKTEE